jgi:hypothetical protein
VELEDGDDDVDMGEQGGGALRRTARLFVVCCI